MWKSLLILTCFLAACGKSKVAQTTIDTRLAALVGSSNSGATVYTNSCQKCHGTKAVGLKDAPNIVNKTLGNIGNAVINGYDDMPALPELSDQNIVDVFEYLKSLR